MKARENSKRGEAPRGVQLFRRRKALKGKIPGAFQDEISLGGAGRRKPLRRCETSRAERAG